MPIVHFYPCTYHSMFYPIHNRLRFSKFPASLVNYYENRQQGCLKSYHPKKYTAAKAAMINR